MSSPAVSTLRAPEIGDPAIDIAVSGFRWILGPDRTIDWSVSGGTLGEAWPNPQAMVAAMSGALATIAAVADVRFNYIGTYADPAAAAAAGSEINLAPIRDRQSVSDSTLGQSWYPRASDGAKAGDVVVNLNSIAGAYGSYAPGGAGFNLLLHELGHTLGLKHPFESDGVGRLTQEETRFANRDVDWFTAMSYNDPYQSQREKFEPATPMALDVAALQHLYGPNRATNAGDNLHELTVNETYQSIWDAGGADTVSVAASPEGWDINLSYDRISTLSPTWTGFALPISDRRFPAAHTLYWLIGEIENLTGSAFADFLTGGPGQNRLKGGGGWDVLDGFQGWDTAVYDGHSGDFRWSKVEDGRWLIVDLRPDAPEGTDVLLRIEALSFADREVALVPRLNDALEAAFRNVLRVDGYAPPNLALAAELNALPPAAAAARLVGLTDRTTSVATLNYQFFTGKAPSEATLEDLVATASKNPMSLNAAYYEGLSLENRYIDFAVGMSKSEATGRAFAAEYGAKSLLETVRSAYLAIFGAAPSEAKAAAILAGRSDYFAYWGKDGPDGIGTKAAVVGYLLAEAAKADVGTMQTANLKFLADLADGAAFSVDLVGTYGGAPYFG